MTLSSELSVVDNGNAGASAHLPPALPNRFCAVRSHSRALPRRYDPAIHRELEIGIAVMRALEAAMLSLIAEFVAEKVGAL